MEFKALAISIARWFETMPYSKLELWLFKAQPLRRQQGDPWGVCVSVTGPVHVHVCVCVCVPTLLKVADLQTQKVLHLDIL